MSNGGQKRHPLTDILTINGYGLDMDATNAGELRVAFSVGKLGSFIQSITRGVLEYCSDDKDASLQVDLALETMVSVVDTSMKNGEKLVVVFPSVTFYVNEDEDVTLEQGDETND